MERNTEFKYESVQDGQTIQKYLDELKSGLHKGRIDFRNDSETLTLNPSGMLNLSIKAVRKERKAKLTLKISWKERSLKHVEQSPLLIESGE
jgi:amphi-Trp domain-containing protein